MEILGIGPLEFFFILLIALVILGPKDMVKAGQTIGKFLNRLVKSPTWRTLLKATQEIKYIPSKLMREANLDEIIKDIPSPQQIMNDSGAKELSNISQSLQQDFSDWVKPPSLDIKSENLPEQGKKENL